jgi:capsid protein
MLERFWKKKEDVFDVLYGQSARASDAGSSRAAPVTSVGSLPTVRYVYDTGEKFSGGLGPIDILFKDYWALRARSSELFERNLYARGLIRRLVTNEINVGLHLEATPEERILGYEEDRLADWAEDVENRFKIWEKNPYLCDHNERRTFGALQAEARREALVAGDVLVVLRQDQRTKLPRVQLFGGGAVQTPLGGVRLPEGVEIVHGVERHIERGDHIAYWVRQRDGTAKRLPAYGEKSGRRIAWLLYGTDKRLDDVRGTPLLGLVLQSLKEIDRYRDSTQRKAVINSMLAMFVMKTRERSGSRPLAASAVRKGSEVTVDNTGAPRRFKHVEGHPGMVLDELQYGEEPKVFQTQHTLEDFATFEEAIVQAIAWANEIPPEILRLSFSSNYSASQAAINEFRLYLNPMRTRFGEEFCSPIYEEWLRAEVMKGNIQAPGLVDAFLSVEKYNEYGAWISCDWSGNVKPSVDLTKVARAYAEQVDQGFITRDRASREINGTKFSKNVKKLFRENTALATARKPLEPAPKAPAPVEPEDDEAEGSENEKGRS